jgi:tetratricopeptide (TPR) repeat protein
MLAPGEHLTSRFVLIRRLGGGEGGEVWIVHDRELDEEVVAKILPADAPDESITLLRHEYLQSRRLNHPGIVRVFGFHRGADRVFTTMEMIDGENLTGLRGRAPIEIVQTLLPVAEALDHAHGLGVVHRDLKATNVVRDVKGRPHVLDFGISGSIGDPEGIVLRGGGSRYNVSPQQLDGNDPSPTDDLYAFGTLLYDLIAGGPPFPVDADDDRIRFEEPAPPVSSYPVTERLRALVTALLSKSPEARPASMAAVVAKLSAIGRELEVAPPPTSPGKKEISLTPPPRVGAVRPVPIGPPRPGQPEARGRGRWFWITAVAIVSLALVAVGVFVLLPRWAAERRAAAKLESAPVIPDPGNNLESEPPIVEREPPETSPRTRRDQAYLEERAEEALERVTVLRKSLDDRGADLWGGETWEQGLRFLENGDEQMSAMAFGGADEGYRRAVALFEALEAAAPEVFRDAIEDGREALAVGDATGAEVAFHLATTIAPRSEEARAGLERAKVLDRVVALVEAGAESERDWDLARAEERYREAVSLDPLSRQAQESLARVQARISNDAFARAMSDGLAALEEGDYARARVAFERAASIQPESPQVSEALAQVDQREKLDDILGHRQRALDLEDAEKWHEAAGEYDSALKIDPMIRFAQEGKRRCTTRAILTDRIDYHLAHPGRLSSDRVYEEAQEVLLEAEEVVEPPVGLQHRTQSLDRLLKAAATPVRVWLESDDLTEVTVYHVGRLGTFRRRELVLRPGNYTVVGSREGYRDVRRTLVVIAGAEPAPMTVRCEEPI